MRINTIRIQTFRSFDDLSVSLENFTSLVGPNGAGKSTILCALNIFSGRLTETLQIRSTIAIPFVRSKSRSYLMT
ncbi:AAA family ATPase [Mesorhizobium sp. NPDC059025]